MTPGADFLDDAIATFRRYKVMAERAMEQLDGERMHWQSDPDANSVVIVVKHIAGNMRSRWTDFLTSDGEKEWRERDGEFVDDFTSREQLMEMWEEGWRTLFDALEPLTEAHLARTVTIRGREHTVVQAILRQLTHYAYHVGQIVHLARMQVGPDDWKTLSIARGESARYRPDGRI